MLFCNFSTDRVQLGNIITQQFLDRDMIETTLPVAMTTRYQKQWFEKMLVLNGPGWFTNLRVGTLVVNLLQELVPDLIVYSVSKIELYKYLYKQWFVPQFCYMYIGQKKNIRYYDLKADTYTTQTLEDIKEWQKNVFFDRASKDFRGKIKTQPTIQFDMWPEGLVVMIGEEDTQVTPESLGLKPVKKLEAQYFIEPTIG